MKPKRPPQASCTVQANRDHRSQLVCNHRLQFVIRSPILWSLALSLILAISPGCRPEGVVVESVPEKDSWEKLNTEMGKVEDGIDQTLVKIRQLPRSETRDPEYARTVNMLIIMGRFDKAMDVIALIQDQAIHDNLLLDIVQNQAEESLQFHLSSAAGAAVPDDAATQYYVKRVLDIADRIRGPLCRVKASTEIAAMYLEMDAPGEAMVLLDGELERLRKDTSHPDEKARAFCHLAHWQLRQDTKSGASAMCKEAELSLSDIPDAFLRAACGFDLVNLYTILEDNEGVNRTVVMLETTVEEIVKPVEKATVLLRLAETTLHRRLNEPKADKEKVLSETKKVVLEAIRLREKGSEANPTDEAGMSLLSVSAQEFSELKNEMLRKIALFQLWSTPLEEVWETVLDMDPGPQQDEALTAAARMLLMTGAAEDARAWTEEMTDPLKKQMMLNEIERKGGGSEKVRE